MNYYRLSEGLNKYKLIPETEDVHKHITGEKDYYKSLYLYNDKHYKQWKDTGTIAGISDTKTSKLLFDFDSASNIEAARQDALTVISRLIQKGIPGDAIQIAFSGNKGFGVEVESTSSFTPEEFKNVVFNLAEDLPTFDKVVNDANRVIRIVGTKHPKSGLYKIPLTGNELAELPIDAIKDLASRGEHDADVMDGWQTVQLPDGIVKLKESTKKPVIQHDVIDLDLSLKPKWLSEVRYALQEGYFPSGEGKRNHAFMILASTYKKQGFNKELTYRLLKGVAEVQARRNDGDRYSDKELWNNVVEPIYKPSWKGGIYKDTEDPLLLETAKTLGLKIKSSDTPLIQVNNVTDIFRRFAKDIDKNTIKLGIPSIDKEVRVTTSMLVGLLAPPSAGKTTVALGILNEISKSNELSIFFSLDMGAPLVYQRLLQKHSHVSGKKLFELYKNNDPKILEYEGIVDKEYKNVSFCFRSGTATDDIRNYILEHEIAHGKRAKLIVVDYLECISGPYSDSTANTALISQQLKDIANDLEVTILLLLQPQKSAGDPSAELLSYRQIKGASAIEQACSIIFTMWRPGFSPKAPQDDKYLTIAIVKNRMGSIGKFDFMWDGLTGNLSEMDIMERESFDNLLERKQEEKLANDLN